MTAHESTRQVLACPTCGLPLMRDGADFVCAKPHRFNVSRDGYVNLLVTHQRRHTAPGDDRAMITARRNFLELRHYDPLRDCLRSLVSPGVVLDCGCGEGYYTRHWRQGDPRMVVYGVDIAKIAVQYAARRSQDNTYAVASAYRLPILDSSIDTVLVVFAPLHADELVRVLRPGATLLQINPGPRHLWELKRRLFSRPELHGRPAPPPKDAQLKAVGTNALTYPFTLTTSDDVRSLITMTPYYHRVSSETLAQATSAPITVTADFLVSRFTKA